MLLVFVSQTFAHQNWTTDVFGCLIVQSGTSGHVIQIWHLQLPTCDFISFRS